LSEQARPPQGRHAVAVPGSWRGGCDDANPH
jgi:hypothetical protein